jgi:hypothetical protein
VRADGAQAGEGSRNWSGYETTASQDYYLDVEVKYNEPQALTTSCTGNAEVTWAGLGGDTVFNPNNVDLGQAGTGINTPKLGQHQAWSEVLPTEPGIMPQPLFAHAGYSFSVTVDWAGGPPYLFDLIDGYSNTELVYYDYASAYAGYTAEAIAERPKVGSGPVPLTNFSYINFLSAGTHAVGSSNTLFGQFPHQSIDMYSNQTGNHLAHPGALTNNKAFTDTWLNCG